MLHRYHEHGAFFPARFCGSERGIEVRSSHAGRVDFAIGRPVISGK